MRENCDRQQVDRFLWKLPRNTYLGLSTVVSGSSQSAETDLHKAASAHAGWACLSSWCSNHLMWWWWWWWWRRAWILCWLSWTLIVLFTFCYMTPFDVTFNMWLSLSCFTDLFELFSSIPLMLMRLVMAGRLDHPRERCLFSNLSNIVSKLLTPVYHQTVRDEIVLPDRQVHRQRARQINKYAATAVTVVQRLVWPISIAQTKAEHSRTRRGWQERVHGQL